MRIIALIIFVVFFNLSGYAQDNNNEPGASKMEVAALFMLNCDPAAPATTCPGADSCKVEPGSITKSQVEGIGLVWDDVVEKLTKDGYAEIISPEEFRLTQDKNKNINTQELFGDDSGKFTTLMIKSQAKSVVKFFDKDGKLIEERYADENKDVVLKKYNENGEVISEDKMTEDKLNDFLSAGAKPKE